MAPWKSGRKTSKNSEFKSVEIIVNNYEILVIFDTNGVVDPVDTMIESFSSRLVELGAQVTDKENLGHKVFSREAKLHRQSGHYVKVWLRMTSEVAGQIQDHFRLDESIFRLIVSRNPGTFRPTDVPPPVVHDVVEPPVETIA